MSTYKSNIPKADFLMGAMRSMGYSFEAAIADIIDNSVSANANNICIKFPVDPRLLYVSVLDDGIGMDKETLFDAMKYGSSSCEEHRSDNDLGRFGLGLKAASLSQCKLLTVASNNNGCISAYRWDYDFILKSKEWLVIELDEREISSLKEIDQLKLQRNGTLVIWENFDVIEKSSGDVFSSLNEYKIKVIDYLSLIFHRYLNSEDSHKIKISVNHNILNGLDPFLEKHKKTNQRQEFNLAIKNSFGVECQIRVLPFVLPYQKELSKEDVKLLGGIENLRTKQGFYIYRNNRLIIWGTWFGLPRNELTKNARIRVDIPNTLDDIWSIDIKKQNAVIPKAIKNNLVKAVEKAMELAIKVQIHRGRVTKINDGLDYIWNRIEGREKKYFYTINRNNRMFQLLKEHVDEESMNRFELVLEEIERNIPFQQLYIDVSQDIIDEEDDNERLKDIENKGIMWVNEVIKLGSLTAHQAIDQLFKSEPFCKHPTMKSNIQEYYKL